MNPASTRIEVLFSPADFAALRDRDLSGTTCVVFDVLRATSSMITALSNGAVSIVPVQDIAEALGIRARRAEVLLAGEREGLRINAGLTGGVEFDLGNSPREFVPEAVRGKAIVMTTTNGTHALRACAHAQRVLVAAFLNLRAVAETILRFPPAHLLLICSGTFEEAALEDVLGAGALCDLVWAHYGNGMVSDSALIARALYHMERDNLPDAFAKGRNGRRLLSRPELREDVAFCARRDVHPMVAVLKDGLVIPTA